MKGVCALTRTALHALATTCRPTFRACGAGVWARASRTDECDVDEADADAQSAVGEAEEPPGLQDEAGADITDDRARLEPRRGGRHLGLVCAQRAERVGQLEREERAAAERVDEERRRDVVR
eukprot:524495-Pleurochrysis_carterae.AAC.2